MHQQSSRQLQERRTSLDVAAVLATAQRFFARQSGVYSAFVEKQGSNHVVLRGQGGEEIAIGARAIEGGCAVTGSSYLFDQQVARFLDSLPPFSEVVPVVADAPTADAPATDGVAGAKS